MDSPSSRERREKEREDLRELNSRFAQVLATVRKANFSLTLKIGSINDEEQLNNEYGQLAAKKLDEVQKTIALMDNDIGAAKEAIQNLVNRSKGESNRVQKHIQDIESEVSRLLPLLKTTAAKITDVEVEMLRIRSQHSSSVASLDHNNKCISQLAFRKGTADMCMLELQGKQKLLDAELNKTRDEITELLRNLERFSDEDMQFKHRGQLQQLLQQRENELEDKVQQDIERDLEKVNANHQREVDALNSSVAPQVSPADAERLLNNMRTELSKLKDERAKLALKQNEARNDIAKREQSIETHRHHRDRTTAVTDEIKSKTAALQTQTDALHHTEDGLNGKLSTAMAQLAAANEKKEVEALELKLQDLIEERDINERRRQNEVILQEEIKQYRDVLLAVEKKFVKDRKKLAGTRHKPSSPPTGPGFPFHPPPGSASEQTAGPSSGAAALTPNVTPRRIVKKGTAKGSASKKRVEKEGEDVLAPPALAFTPTPKKRKHTDRTVHISTIDPLHQRVVIENGSDETQDISGWKIQNTTYAFTQAVPMNVVLPPGGTFTFMPRPASTKRRPRPGDKEQAAANNSSAPSFHAFWDTGNRDIQWPMQNARAVLRDNHGTVIHDYTLS